MTFLSRLCLPAALLGVLALMPPATARPDDEGVATATLVMEPTKLDWAGNKAANLMYFPAGAKLTDRKPDWVKKEPAYAGKPKYATVKVGNGTPNEFVLAFDEPDGKDPKVYVDANGDGDLTNDPEVKWIIETPEAGHAPNLHGTFVFNVHWKNSDGTATEGKYGLNFYRSTDRDSVNYYRAAARTGKIVIAGKTYEVMLREEDGDGIFNKLFDPKATAPAKTKPVNLKLDGDQYDIRGTFSFAESNYLATVTEDGAKLTMRPTAKVIRMPRVAAGPDGDKPALLKVGAVAPDFSVLAWNPSQPVGEEPKTIKLSDYRGKKVVVIDFWATWCGPCMQGLPHVSELAAKLKGQDAVVLAVNTWDDQAAYERFARTKGKEMAVSFVRDPAGKSNDNKDSIASKSYAVHGIPATYVIDKDGKVAAAVGGFDPENKDVVGALKKLGIKVD